MSRFNNWSLNINKINLSHAERHLDEFDIIINTTPAGMYGNKDSVISLNRLASHTLVSDIVYNPYKTPILLEAEQRGNPIYNGLDMFVHQGAESFKIWTNLEPDIEAMKNVVIHEMKGEL